MDRAEVTIDAVVGDDVIEQLHYCCVMSNVM